MTLENEVIHLMFKLNLQIEQERPFSSEATMSPKISSSPLFTFSAKIVDFSWKRLLIVLRTSAKSSYWLVSFFLLFLLAWTTTWHRIGPTLISAWAFFSTGHTWTHLSFDGSIWCIWFCAWHSTCIVIRNRRHFMFFIFLIAAAINVAIVTL